MTSSYKDKVHDQRTYDTGKKKKIAFAEEHKVNHCPKTCKEEKKSIYILVT